jgi:AcrR family transcriptional regulator
MKTTGGVRADRKPHKRRGEVLDAAARVFSEKGYDATTIQDIADEVGILKGSVYYYISSKEEVLFELLTEVHRAAFAAVKEAVAGDADPLTKIYNFVDTLARFNAENKIRMGILLHDFRSLNDEHRAQIVKERDLYDKLLRKLIVEGQSTGAVCPDLDPKLSTLAAMGTINTIYQWYRPTGGRKPAAIGKGYAEFVVRALSCSPETHSAGHLSGLTLSGSAS